MKFFSSGAREPAGAGPVEGVGGAYGRRPPREFVVPMIVGCALFMENLDSTVITTALPVMAHSLHQNAITLNLAITSYLLSLAVFIPVSGWVADRFGARNVFRLAIIIFTFGSMLCGVSNSLLQLVGARILQGMGGSMMVPVGRLVVLRSIDRRGLVQAMSYLTVPAILGPVIGPLLGGFIVTYYSWRWIFFMNVPICLVGIVLVSLFIPVIQADAVPPLDLPGFALTGIGLAGVVLGLETVGRGMLPAAVVISALVIGAACLVLYWRHAHRAINPILDLSLLDIRTFSIATVGGGVIYRMGIGALPFLLAMQLQLGFGLSPFKSGLLTFASAAGSFLMKFTVHHFVRLFGFRKVLIINGFITAISVAACALFTRDTPHLVIGTVLLVGGFFRSLQYTSLNSLAYADVPSRLISNASTVASMAQQLAMSFGITFAALTLHICLVLHHETAVSARDFVPAYVLTTIVSLFALLYFAQLAPSAGSELSGHQGAVESAADDDQSTVSSLLATHHLES